MRRTLAIALTLLASVAPPAQASTRANGCGIAVFGRTVTGSDTWTGVVYGFVVAPEEDVSIRCYLTVDGVPVPGGSTGTMTGSTATVTATTVSYLAANPKAVQVCTEWTAGSEGGTRCASSPNAGVTVPPETQPLVDAFYDVWYSFWSVADVADLMECPILATLTPGVPGIVDIDNQGDVVVLGNWLWDCPPYGV